MDDTAKSRKGHADEPCARFVKASVRGFLSFFLFFLAIMSSCVFDAVGSRNGIALSMIAACVFLAATAWFGGKAVYLFFKYKDTLTNAPSFKSEKMRAPAAPASPPPVAPKMCRVAPPAKIPAPAVRRTEEDDDDGDEYFETLEKDSKPQEIIVRNKSVDALVTVAKIAGIIWLFS